MVKPKHSTFMCAPRLALPCLANHNSTTPFVTNGSAAANWPIPSTTLKLKLNTFKPNSNTHTKSSPKWIVKNFNLPICQSAINLHNNNNNNIEKMRSIKNLKLKFSPHVGICYFCMVFLNKQNVTPNKNTTNNPLVNYSNIRTY